MLSVRLRGDLVSQLKAFMTERPKYVESSDDSQKERASQDESRGLDFPAIARQWLILG